MNTDKTIVTACDANYIWGALLLIMSLKKYDVKAKIIVNAYDFDDKQVGYLKQFPDVDVIVGANPGRQSICIMKPQAIFSAETEWVIWMDADCVVTHDVTDMLITSKDGIQIRFREKKENATVYRNYYRKNDVVGDIPAEVLAAWRSDINERDESRIDTVCQTNCFVIHRDKFPFIYKWQDQMLKVLPAQLLNVYNKSDTAYSMTDESVLNSLMAFSKEIPTISEYLLDQGNPPYLVHFGLAQKPWVGWNCRTLKYYNFIQELLEWTRQQGYILPSIPKSMRIENRNSEFLKAYYTAVTSGSKYQLSNFLRNILRKFR
ncbi:MAG: hypothetical protein JXR56_09125 [Candidatus Cloacimonetes bacterium]|nr:hypothetical protein [Candidatus Cloacimonadota bacterium]